MNDDIKTNYIDFIKHKMIIRYEKCEQRWVYTCNGLKVLHVLPDITADEYIYKYGVK